MKLWFTPSEDFLFRAHLLYVDACVLIPSVGQGEDVVHPLKVSLEDMYNGRTCKLAVTREVLDGEAKKCTTCDGQGAVIQVVRMGPMIQQIQQPCSKCSGTGYMVKTKRERKVLEVPVEKGMKNGHKVIMCFSLSLSVVRRLPCSQVKCRLDLIFDCVHDLYLFLCVLREMTFRFSGLVCALHFVVRFRSVAWQTKNPTWSLGTLFSRSKRSHMAFSRERATTF